MSITWGAVAWAGKQSTCGINKDLLRMRRKQSRSIQCHYCTHSLLIPLEMMNCVKLRRKQRLVIIVIQRTHYIVADNLRRKRVVFRPLVLFAYFRFISDRFCLWPLNLSPFPNTNLLLPNTCFMTLAVSKVNIVKRRFQDTFVSNHGRSGDAMR
jgi:hypothetical protein